MKSALQDLDSKYFIFGLLFQEYFTYTELIVRGGREWSILGGKNICCTVGELFVHVKWVRLESQQ